MVDLATREAPRDVRRRGSANRDFTLPGRRQTDAPNLEVNATIQRPNQSEAQRLSEILRLGENAADAAAGLVLANGQRQNREDAAAGVLAGQRGVADPQQMEDSRAYRDAYYTEGARRAALDLDARVTEAVRTRLQDEDDPATPEDILSILDGEFTAIGLDENGLPRDFGSPGAARVLAENMANIRARLLPQALEAIRTQTNTRLADNIAANIVRTGAPLLEDRNRVPLAGDVQAVDPGASVPGGGQPAAAPSATPAAPSGPRTASEVTALVRSIAPDVTITSTARSRNSRLGQENPTSYHNSGRAIDMAPVPGMTFEEMRDTLRARGLNIVEAINEVENPSPHSTGPHWHFAWGDPEDAPSVVDVQTATPAGAVTPPAYDFEAIIDRMPGVSRPEAKELLLPALVLHAEQAGNGNFLRGIAQSTREDGTPSFNPTEILQLRTEARRIDAQAREEADRIQRERYAANADRFLETFINGGTPSLASIRQAVENDAISAEFGYSLVNQIEAEARQAEREAKADARDAEARLENDIDASLAAELEARLAGDIGGATEAADLARFRRGEFGTGRRAAARLRRMRTAAQTGGRVRLEEPDGALYGARLRQDFPTARRGDGSLLRSRNAVDPAIAAAALAHYNSQVRSGVRPAEAYTATIERYRPRAGNTAASEDARRRELTGRR